MISSTIYEVFAIFWHRKVSLDSHRWQNLDPSVHFLGEKGKGVLF